MSARPIRVRCSSLRGQIEAERRDDGIEATVRVLDDRVGAVDQVGVGAGAAAQRVGARPAVEQIVEVAAFQHVPAGPAEQPVVAAEAAQRVGAVAAAQLVRGEAAFDDVVEAVAGAIDRYRPAERQVLDVGRQGVAEEAADRVDAGPGRLAHPVARIVDHVEVVAGTALHPIGAPPRVEEVVARAAAERIVAAVVEQGVVARAAIQQVVVVAAIELVLPVAAEQLVAALAAEQLVVAAEPADHVGARGADQQVAGAAAPDHRHVPPPRSVWPTLLTRPRLERVRRGAARLFVALPGYSTSEPPAGARPLDNAAARRPAHMPA